MSYEDTARQAYLLKEFNPHRAINILSERSSLGYEPMLVTRADPGEVGKINGFKTIWLTESNFSDMQTASDLGVLKQKIIDFLKSNNKPALLLDRIDYLINMHGFSNFLKFVYSVTDHFATTKSFLALNVNPRTLSSQQMSLLEQELNSFYGEDAETELELSDDSMEILSYVTYSEKKISFKDISKQFTITKTTTRKRINKLFSRGLISVSKNGRNKIVKITEMGKRYL